MPLILNLLEKLLNSKFVSFDEQDSGLFIKLRENDSETLHFCEVDQYTGKGVKLPPHYKVEFADALDICADGADVVRHEDGAWLSTNWVGRLHECLEKSKHGVFVLPEFADGGNYAIQVGKKSDTFDTFYMPCFDTLGYGIHAVKYEIFTSSLKCFAEAKAKYPEKFLTTHLASARHFLDFEPSLWDTASFGSHCKEARRIEKDRLFGEQVASKLGFSVPKSIILHNADDVDTVDWDHIPTDKIAVKYLNDQFIGIMTKDDLDVIRGLLQNQSEPLFIQEYLGAQVDEYNFMFLINDNYVVPVGTSIEHNRLLENGLGGKAGNTLSAQYIGMSPAIVEVMNKLKDLYKHVSGINGWVDITFIKSGDTFYFTEWMVRTACSNFAVLLDQLDISYVDVLHLLDRKQLSLCHLTGSNRKYSMGLDLFQVEFALSLDSSPIFVRPPKNFIPIDSGMGVFNNGNLTLIPVNMDRKNPRIGVIRESGNDALVIANTIMDYAKDTTNIPDLAYRTDLVSWADRLELLPTLEFK